MPQQDLELVAHLMRRAGFGATRDDLEELASRDYEGLVEDLLHPERFPDLEEDVLHRYHIDINDQDGLRAQSRWIYRMINTQTPLKEKLTLFWHRVFATGAGKSMHYPSAVAQRTEMDRKILQISTQTIADFDARFDHMDFYTALEAVWGLIAAAATGWAVNRVIDRIEEFRVRCGASSRSPMPRCCSSALYLPQPGDQSLSAPFSASSGNEYPS
mgnify:CR=1 FL=1